ncbi:amidinotransferase [Fulvivirga sp. RKSG066]|uniref:citrulline utilization hydrolase CtlX n=1 Tax=Fulvivirga aurantia TaxID=2529383 RepID=UPI0012BD2755|nr:arginine deiminase-related protein [Fulvivirga aurantia]MTI20476.1 amidinotransferase [Fulvivirga aurantia]
MAKDCTDTILMVRPRQFGFNEETARNNHYQKKPDDLSENEAQIRAKNEFDTFVEKLRANGIEVIVIEDTPEPHTPDSIFPNNWISFHEKGHIVWYPMYSEIRRGERRGDVIGILKSEHGFKVKQIHDLSIYESENEFLEGTGSMVLDRNNKLAYAAISDRTHEKVLDVFTKKMGYTPIKFTANQTVNQSRLPIYHTNVMMCVAEKFVIICLESIDDPSEKQMLLDTFKKTDKEVIEISEAQCNQFAGNMLQVNNKNGDRFLVMSSTAFNSLNDQQISAIEKHCDIIHSSLKTIETLGGGSARCMMAEVFLPKQEVVS